MQVPSGNLGLGHVASFSSQVITLSSTSVFCSLAPKSWTHWFLPVRMSPSTWALLANLSVTWVFVIAVRLHARSFLVFCCSLSLEICKPSLGSLPPRWDKGFPSSALSPTAGAFHACVTSTALQLLPSATLRPLQFPEATLLLPLNPGPHHTRKELYHLPAPILLLIAM